MRKDVALLQREPAEVEPVGGEEDEWLAPSQSGVVAGGIPDAEIWFVAGVGHFVVEGVSEWVAENLAGFFAPRGVT